MKSKISNMFLYEYMKEAYIFVRKGFFAFLTYISPKTNNQIRYREIYHKSLPLHDPITFEEKLLYLKLNNYNNNKLVKRCADKLAVREYVKECGFDNILNKLYAVYESANDIQWNELPNQFVLKWNFGAGMNIICKDKSCLQYNEIVKQMNKWGKSKYWLSHAEMQYKDMPKRIICEAYLSDSNHDVIPDYKVYCFHGEPKAILLMEGRGHEITSQFFDMNWNKLRGINKYKEIKSDVKKPKELSVMIEAAERLSKPFPFVRCDFYVVDEKIYFGEMTFTPAGGFKPSQTDANDLDMAKLIVL